MGCNCQTVCKLIVLKGYLKVSGSLLIWQQISLKTAAVSFQLAPTLPKTKPPASVVCRRFRFGLAKPGYSTARAAS
ncbi:hypothetical protein EIKCOROL_01417 [Eikenella corrodens ATCC 23834]|uniref:Uncharacterized protein n=1 Tax=Eikenella corrodens ATCC 23834 TaxID=546274 RepID=C0DVM8_EIKCO|nr:hypothetical protein EIKCOROL_01417 [Eikenella corrodens ATCC 23834]